ncbi:MAG: hypothetical protein AMS27_10690, partial [Bacteroides sp. SM23_62_1]
MKKIAVIALFILISLTSTAQSYEAAPNFSWVNTVHELGTANVHDVITDETGNIYITGQYSGELTLESTTITSTGLKEFFIARYNNSGKLLWLRQVKCPEYETIISNSLALDENGHIYVTGYYEASEANFGSVTLQSSDKGDLFVARYDSNGLCQWARKYGDDLNNYGIKIAVDETGNSYVICSGGIASFGSSIIKFNPEGFMQWEKMTNVSFNDIKASNAGIYLSGKYVSNDSIKFDEITLPPAQNGKIVFVTKLDPDNGFVDWVTIGKAKFTEKFGLQIDNDDNIYLCGYYEEWLTFENDTLTNILDKNFWSDIYMVKFDKDGAKQWITGTGDHREGGIRLPYDFDLDKNNNLVFCGYLYGKIICGNDTINISGGYIVGGFSTEGEPLWCKTRDRNVFKIEGSINNTILTYSDKSDWINIDVFDYENQKLFEIAGPKNDGVAVYSGNGGERLTLDPDNKLCVQFSTSGPVKYMNTSVNKPSLIIAKIDTTGDLDWINNYRYTSHIYTIGNVCDKHGNIYAYGYFQDTIYLENGYLAASNQSAWDGYLIKLSVSGDLIWYKTIYSTSHITDIGWNTARICNDSEGNILIAGNYYDTIFIGSSFHVFRGYQDIFIMKIDSMGNINWSKSFGGEENDNLGNIFSYENDLYLNGYFDLPIIYEDTLINSDGRVCMTAKIDSSGHLIWIKEINNSSLTQYNGIVPDSKGSYYYHENYNNYWEETYIIDSISIPISKNNGIVFAKFGPGGLIQKAQLIEGGATSANLVDIDKEDNVYIAGSFRNDLVIPGDTILYTFSDLETCFIIKYDPDGIMQWIKSIPDYLKLTGLCVIDEDKLYLMGTLSEGVEIIDSFKLASITDNMLFARLGGQIINISNTSHSVFPESLYSSNTLKIYPNPVTHQATIQF